MGKITQAQAFLRVLRVSSVNIIPPWLSILTYLVGEQQACWWPQFGESLALSIRTIINISARWQFHVMAASPRNQLVRGLSGLKEQYGHSDGQKTTLPIIKPRLFGVFTI
jgi:hypothetical protein